MPARLVLAGCGHAHLFVLEALAAGRLRGAEVTLVSPDDEYFYSGMIPGVVAGCYRSEQARFRPPALARAAGARWVCGRVGHVETGRRRVRLDDGGALEYDLLSLDIGAGVAGDDLPGVREHAVPVKPMSRALGIVSRVERALGRAPAGRPARVVVVGGGAAGVEMAICLHARFARGSAGPALSITVLESSDRVLSEYPEPFRNRAAEVLDSRGIGVKTGVRVAAVRADAVTAEDSSEFPFHAVLWATGPRAPAPIAGSGLPTDERGYLLVEPALRAAGLAEVFGAGDCAVLRDDRWVPRAGVYAVRAGPVLADNLGRALRGRPLRPYRPQRTWLSLMNTGDGHALASYRGYAFRGRVAWWLKDRIDRRFMRRFQRLERRG